MTCNTTYFQVIWKIHKNIYKTLSNYKAGANNPDTRQLTQTVRSPLAAHSPPLTTDTQTVSHQPPPQLQNRKHRHQNPKRRDMQGNSKHRHQNLWHRHSKPQHERKITIRRESALNSIVQLYRQGNRALRHCKTGGKARQVAPHPHKTKPTALSLQDVAYSASITQSKTV